MPTPECIDLRERFGADYRIGLDESAECRSDPWMYRLLCRRGVIFPWGGSRLAAMIDYRPGVARQVAVIPGVRLEQGGDREFTFSFDAELFPQIAEIVQPRRRRRLSAEQRAACSAQLAPHRFRSSRTPEQISVAQTSQD